MKNVFLPASAICLYLSAGMTATAQIVPDATLPNNSIVTPLVDPTGGRQATDLNISIEGGSRAGNNLFHSFSEFSVPTGGTASFNNAIDIKNIFSRVTGSNISNIDGSIRANGTANLFLLNPNGIIFGPNAKLNIGGSFLGTTANSIQFSDRISFSATEPQSTALLSINIPIGLQFGQNPGDILVTGSGHTFSRPSSGPISKTSEFNVLQVNGGQTFALVGGNISLTGGNLRVEGGRIELGSVAGGSLVSINNLPLGWSFGYDGVQNFGNIQLSQSASVDISGGNSTGELRIKSDRLTLQNLSLLLSQTFTGVAGGNIDINVNLLEVLTNDNVNSDFVGGILTQTSGEAGAGNINIVAQKIQSNSTIISTSFATGNSGDITAIATDEIEIIGGGTISALTREGTATAGNITIETGKLTLQEGSQIGSNSTSDGGAGNVTVTANTIDLIGAKVLAKNDNTIGSFASGIFAVAVNIEGGNITVNTNILNIQDGASISAISVPTANLFPANSAPEVYVPEAGNITINADTIQVVGTAQNLIAQSDSSLNPGVTYNLPQDLASSQISVSSATNADAGNLTINTRKLTVSDGGLINASTSSVGVAGNIYINATESIEVSGVSPIDPLGIISQRPSTLASAAVLNALGSGGNIRVTTNSLSVGNGGQLNVSASGTGSAGNLEITAQNVSLFDGSSFNAQTQAGDRGNINIDTEDLRVLNNSRISTDAGGTATGGNIDIDTETLVVRENSAISANAIEGQGGKIEINTSGIFISDNGVISASSLAGAQFDGTVEVRTPASTVQNAFATVDTSIKVDETIVAGSCFAGADRQQNSFTVTGTSGLPINPYDPLNSRYNVAQVQRRLYNNSGRSQPAESSQINTQIVEASGWVITDKGEVVLTVNNDNVASSQVKYPCF